MASEYYTNPDFSRKRRSSQFETTPSKREYTDKVRGLKFLVPEYAAGAIIGKAGKNITELKERFGTFVKMSPGKVYFPKTEDRVCLITSDQGGDESIIACFHHLNQMTREDSEQGDRRRRPKDPDRLNQVKLLLTNNTAGLIIGKGGETIKSIQEQTVTRIMITPFDPELDERVCCISADDYENTLKATDYILDKVIKDPEGHVSRNLIYSGGPVDSYSPRQSYRGSGGADYDRRGGYDRGYAPSRYQERTSEYSYNSMPAVETGVSGNLYVLDDRDSSCLILGIMEKYVGGIVGRNGSTISDIQSQTHTHIQISHKEEYIPGTRDRKITIKGEPQAVESAYFLVSEKVSEFTDRRRN